MSRSGKTLLIAAVLTAIVTHFRWFTGFHVLASGDWHATFSEVARQALGWPSLWSYGGFGFLNVHAPFYLLHLAHDLLANLGLSFGAIERLLYLWPIVILTPLGSFLLIRRVTGSDVGAFAGSFAYTYNTYFLTIQTQHVYIMLADAFAPLAVLAFIAAVEGSRPKRVIWAGLALFAVSACDFRIFYILSFILAAYAVAEAVWSGKFRRRRALLGAAVTAAVPFLIVLALNSYWMIGFSRTSTLTSNDLFNRPLFENNPHTLLRVFATSGGAWTDGALEWFGSNPIIPRFWLLPILAFLGFLVARRDRRAVYFAFVTLLGITLVKQVGAPFGGLYVWLYAHFPGFNAFRESSKFAVLTLMGYAVLMGYLAAWVWRWAAPGRWRSIIKYLLVGTIIGLYLLNARPLLNGEIGTLFKPAVIDPDYAVLNDRLRGQPEFFRTLGVPRSADWILSGRQHQRLSSSEVGNTWRRLSAEAGPSGGSTSVDMFGDEKGSRVLDLLSVRYVIVPVGDLSGGKDVFDLYYLERQDVVDRLDSVPFLRRLDLGTERLAVYENDDYRPFVYLTAAPDEPASFQREIIAVEDRFHSATRYSLRVDGATGPFYLNFGQAYHPEWGLAVGKFSWARTSLFGREATPGVTHIRGGVDNNVFLVDPAALCASGRCQGDAVGGYDLDLTLFFRPQRYVYAGLVVSVAVLAGCLAFLALGRRRHDPGRVSARTRTL